MRADANRKSDETKVSDLSINHIFKYGISTAEFLKKIPSLLVYLDAHVTFKVYQDLLGGGEFS